MATIRVPIGGHLRGFKTGASAAQLELIANAVANVKIVVTSMVVSSIAAQQVTFGTDENAISGIHHTGDTEGSLVLPYNKKGWFECDAAEPLDVLLGQAVSTGFTFTYYLTT